MSRATAADGQPIRPVAVPRLFHAIAETYDVEVTIPPGLARSWAAEVVAQGVTVNLVSPAATQTAMTEDPARQAAAMPASMAWAQFDTSAVVGTVRDSSQAAVPGAKVTLGRLSSLFPWTTT